MFQVRLGNNLCGGPVIIIAIIIIAMSKQSILNLGETLAKGLGQNITLIRGVSLFLTI